MKCYKESCSIAIFSRRKCCYAFSVEVLITLKQRNVEGDFCDLYVLTYLLPLSREQVGGSDITSCIRGNIIDNTT